jgi:hypothetical protein
MLPEGGSWLGDACPEEFCDLGRCLLLLPERGRAFQSDSMMGLAIMVLMVTLLLAIVTGRAYFRPKQ